MGCSHGTDSVDGRAAVRALLNDVAAARPDVDVHEAFVDVQRPRLGEVVTDITAPLTGDPREAVVVPLLLSAGYHVNVDVMEAVAAVPDRAVAAGALGPDSRLTALIVDRLYAVGVRPADAVVLAAAGSSDPRAVSDVELVAQELRTHHDGPVTVGYGSIAKPSLPEAVRAARSRLPEGARVVVAAYLLAPGFFYNKVRAAGADLVTAPLAPDARLTAIVLDRYSAAAQRDARLPMLGAVNHRQLPRGGRPAAALEEIEASIEAAWQVFQASADVVAGSPDEIPLAEAVLQDPSEFEWRVVDGALNRLTCQDCRSTLGAGPVGCDRCDQANGYRFAAKEINRPHVPAGNEHALRVASAVARTRHRYSARARCGYELGLPGLLAGELPTTAEAQAAKAQINTLSDAELDSVMSLSDLVARSATATPRGTM